MFGAIRAFEMVLKYFGIIWRMSTSVIFVPVIYFMRMDQLCVTFLSVRAVEMIESLAGNFKMRFIGFL